MAVEYDGFPVVEWTLYFTNTGTADIPILSDIFALDINLDFGVEGNEDKVVLHHFAGGFAEPSAYRPFQTVMQPRTNKRFSGAGGRPTNTEMSYFNFEGRIDEGVFLVVGWPGQWLAEFSCGSDRTMHVTAGQELTHFTLRAHEGTEVWREHPQWVLKLWNQPNGVFNFGIPEARQWMTERIGGLIDDFGIDIYREDFNIDPLAFWRYKDTADRQGMTELKWVAGFYQFWDDLLGARPNLIIDNCASGGRRIDLETCMRAIPMWRSDTSCGPGHSDWHQVQTIGLSSYIVLHLACTHSHETYDCRSSATIGGVSQWQLLDADFPFELAREATAELRANRPYWLGDFYPLTKASHSPDDWLAFQLHREDLDEGIILAFRREQCPTSALQVSPRGLSPAGNYSLTLSDESRNRTNRQISGTEMTAGLSLDIPQPRASLLVTYQGCQ